MRIYGPNGPAAAGAKPAARRTSSGTFVLPESGHMQQPASAAPPRSVAGIEALMALQGVEDPAERRRRAVTRGRSALDVLDELKLDLLAGRLGPQVINRLKTAAASLKEATGDPGLDGVLAEIELRVEVELAKMKPAGEP
jgi:hypothetical protein